MTQRSVLGGQTAERPLPMCDTVQMRWLGAATCIIGVLRLYGLPRLDTRGEPTWESCMNMDQMWGRLGEARAKVKELAGTLVGDSTMISEARSEFAVRRAQAAFGDAKSAVQERGMITKRGRLSRSS